ncbi:sulfur carrier protein ThiS [Marinobacter hydrocarbonoclasticus]|nr:sulfur carrier protein ThiS [Marinobacter nauticus]
MRIILNQQPQEVTVDTVAELLASLGQDKPGVAVALNGQVVSKSRWGQTALNEGDALDLFSVIAGG